MFLTGQLQFEPSCPSFLGFGFRGAMEREDLGDGAQTQLVAASGSGCFLEVVAQFVGGMLSAGRGAVLCGCGCHRLWTI